jgi:hypothetical protein
MLAFHANFYACPPRLRQAPVGPLRGQSLQALVDPQGRAPLFGDYFPVSFEDAARALVALPGVDAEPDGFFVVSGSGDPARWRISGHLFDFGDRLHRMELNGACPLEVLESLWRCCGWPTTAVACELVREGVVLGEADFRRWAAAERSPSP